jgi:hypothetical protein
MRARNGAHFFSAFFVYFYINGIVLFYYILVQFRKINEKIKSNRYAEQKTI